MSLFHALLNRMLVPWIVLIPCLSWSGSAWGSDTKPRRQNLPFNIEMDEDGIKTFTLLGKKPASDAELLPAVPKSLPRSMSSSEIAQVPEVGLEAPMAKTGTKQDAIEDLEFRFAKVNYFNLKKTDGFLQALLTNRPDLAGLPFKMGTDCRLPPDKALALAEAIGKVHASQESRTPEESLYQPLAAALMQIHGPREKQADLAKTLSTIPHVDATKALVRLALFSPDDKARAIAARGLKIRREQDYTGLLLDGLRYPWPTVARRAVEALVRLERKDLLPQLLHTLESPDPRLPVPSKTGWQARELVRINHHRNCLLCHAPAHTTALLHVPEGPIGLGKIDKIESGLKSVSASEKGANLLAPAPLPNRAFEQGSKYYRDSEMDRILVRADVTYMRQDFSAYLLVADAAPWPDYQRFDFLVRARHLTETEAAALRQRLQTHEAGTLSPYQHAALFGLREMTGLEAATPADWRRLLKLPMPVAQANGP